MTKFETYIAFTGLALYIGLTIYALHLLGSIQL